MIEKQDELAAALASRYEIRREIGRGGMAVVYLAHDIKHGRDVAIKVIKPDLSHSLGAERFLREIDIAARLTHPNILPLHDSGEAAGLLYYVMPYVVGESLRRRLERERQLPVDEAVAIAKQIASALDHAHAQGVVHRDLKPENILMLGDQPMVADFGLARALFTAASAPLTESGLAVGTPAYMSPEQASADRNVDARTDVYSLACLVFEMIAGVPPFRGATAQALIAHHVSSPPPSLYAERRSCPPSVDIPLTRAMAKLPADRFRSAGEFVRALVAAVTGPLAASSPDGAGVFAPRLAPSGAAPEAGRTIAFGRLAPWVALVLLLALGAASVVRLKRSPKPVEGFDPRRIAVLDFEDQSRDRSLGHIASGLTSSLTQELSGVAAIKVLSRNSVRTFHARGLPFDSIVAALSIGSLVEGSIRRSNDRLRVSVQLVDGRTKTQIESATIERPMGELFALEDDLAHQVAVLLRRRIGVEVRIGEALAGTTDARARDLVFRADRIRDNVVAGSSSDTLNLNSVITRLRLADSLLAVAEVADPRWLAPTIDRGWVALDLAGRQSGATRVAAFQRAIAHAERALNRAPAHASALELRGTALYWQAARLDLGDHEFSERLARAEADLKKAVGIDSSLATAWGTLSLVHAARGEMDEAQGEAQAALAMDAYLEDAPIILLALYAANLLKGAFPDAWQWCDRGGRDYPRDQRFIECRLTLLAEDNSRAPDPALAWALVAKANEIDPPAHAKAAGRAFLPLYREMTAAQVSARAGDIDSARAVAVRARATVAREPDLRMDLAYQEAYLHLLLGERSEAIRLLHDYLTERPSMRGFVSRHARWRPLASDSAFTRLITGAK